MFSLTSVTRFSIPTNVTAIRTISLKSVASFILEAVPAAIVLTVFTICTVTASCKVGNKVGNKSSTTTVGIKTAIYFSLCFVSHYDLRIYPYLFLEIHILFSVK